MEQPEDPARADVGQHDSSECKFDKLADRAFRCCEDTEKEVQAEDEQHRVQNGPDEHSSATQSATVFVDANLDFYTHLSD